MKLCRTALQNEYLRKAALLKEKDIYVNWIGNKVYTPVGFNLIAEHKITKSLTKELDLKKTAIRQALTVKTLGLISDRNARMKYLPTAELNYILLRSRLNQFIDAASEGDKPPFFTANGAPDQFDSEELKHIVEDFSEAVNVYYGLVATIQMDQALLDRGFLKGIYWKLLPHFTSEDASLN